MKPAFSECLQPQPTKNACTNTLRSNFDCLNVIDNSPTHASRMALGYSRFDMTDRGVTHLALNGRISAGDDREFRRGHRLLSKGALATANDSTTVVVSPCVDASNNLASE